MSKEGCRRSPVAICNFLHACLDSSRRMYGCGMGSISVGREGTENSDSMGEGIPRIQRWRWAVLLLLLPGCGTADVEGMFCILASLLRAELVL